MEKGTWIVGLALEQGAGVLERRPYVSLWKGLQWTVSMSDPKCEAHYGQAPDQVLPSSTPVSSGRLWLARNGNSATFLIRQYKIMVPGCADGGSTYPDAKRQWLKPS